MVNKTLFLAACFSICLLDQRGQVAIAATTNEATNEKTTVSFYTWRPTDKAVWDQINKRNLIPNVHVETRMIIRPYYFDTILLELQNGTADLFLWQPGASRLKELIDHGFIKPYPHDLSQMNASALAATRGPDEKLYGVPFAVQLQSIMVNKKIAKKHGINEAPKSLEELEAVFKKLKSADITPIHFAVAERWYISQIMGEVFMAGLVDQKFAQGLIDGTECFNSKEYRVIFTTLNRWKKNGYINQDITDSTYFDMYTAVAFGKSAMSFEGGWMTSKAEPYYTMDPSYEFDFWSVPGVSSKFTAFGDGSFQLSATSKNKVAAQRVLEFTVTKQFAELFAEYVEQLPGYGGNIEIKSGDLQIMSNIIAEKGYPVSLFSNYAINRNSPTYNELFETAIVALLEGKQTPEEAVEYIQHGLNKWRYIGYQHCQ